MADPEVRFPETYVSGVPVWARRRKRSGLHPIMSTLVLLLALFGAVVIGVSLRMGSVEKGGVVIDGWIAFAHQQAKATFGELSGEPAKVETPDTMDEPPVGQSGRKGG
ncbi:hypothetical protein [Caulobacter vibrioides]|uniref:Uncharacterized protein n=1 Tax=Caulobacter vibrioides (strain NA1000 / CB15N) TaxID=565050 RepID=A0A0H3ICZ4_CAUVN|nr:hypothetical protein [Caulobacter vibrioides]YP_008877618.1 hypothetical protein CCNA_03901 [Caulobacter vibrioides NA1000]AGJ94617.1 hypothetical protein CCNA_03901 [Caulobacter vibrioides NA1000]QXZ50866.1 hypothetical protein KZH45_13305 [Caulobacter vibrioides]